MVDMIAAPETIESMAISVPSSCNKKLNACQINAQGVGGEEFLPHRAAELMYEDRDPDLQDGVFEVFTDGPAGYAQKPTH